MTGVQTCALPIFAAEGPGVVATTAQEEVLEAADRRAGEDIVLEPGLAVVTAEVEAECFLGVSPGVPAVNANAPGFVRGIGGIGGIEKLEVDLSLAGPSCKFGIAVDSGQAKQVVVVEGKRNDRKGLEAALDFTPVGGRVHEIGRAHV